MSRFQSQQQAIAHLIAQVENLKARISRLTTSGGQVRITSTTIAGGLPAHDHSSVAEGGKTEYGPVILSDWNGNIDPGNIWQALDQLASRIKRIELLNTPATPSAASTMLFNGMEA